jgi:LysR family transcriptional regulator, glycine cleavage system transcriptional activator
VRRLPNFHLLRAFEAAARLQSFSLAAQELNVTPSAVSHQVKQLEGELGYPLFLRAHRKVALTPEAQRFQERLSPLLDALDEACESIARRPAGHALGIYCAPSFAVKWLGPRLPDFVRTHPEISLRLSTGAERPDLLARRDIDVAIFYGAPLAQHGVVVEALGRERIAPLCAPRMARSIGDLGAELASLSLIESPLNPVKWSDWCHWNGVARRPVTRFSMDRAALAIAAAVDGLGIALESTMLAEKELARGDLVELRSPSRAPLERSVHYLCYRETDRPRASMRLFRQWLLQHRMRQSGASVKGKARRSSGLRAAD